MTGLHRLFSRYRNWQLLDEPLSADPQRALQRDTELVRAVAAGLSGPLARLWENPRSLVATRRETRLPQFAEACRRLAAEGWPVLGRDSGGTTVPHEPGILHFSLIFPQYQDSHFDLELIYQALCEPIRLALAELGLDAEYGAVDGAYCDGRYNLVVDGLKVTGTAQRLVGSRARERGISGGVLAQAMLMVECDAARGTEQVNRFYRLAGDPRQYDPAVSTCIAERLAGRLELPPGELTLRMRRLIGQAFRRLAEG
ncbi:lipoate--protein ligase family protein [Marinobacterium arenosum]|uniref:lipoate--protein ligase family protein n=1 Tax=Marinobacterium arenosum TaxID=2862496 RepID=UPI001C9542AB|nr:hypothetical protein [Marinobacterium arenosum]MBY4675105.1 hypothetical protein [Marinobacterium arenosum]